jgi:ABC-type multidrug transport system fused ATPase/permease subunit
MYKIQFQLSIIKKIKFILTKGELGKGYILLVYMIIAMFFETLSIGLIAPLIKVVSEPDILTSTNYLTGVASFLGVDSHNSMIFNFSIIIIVIYIIKNIYLGFFSWFKIKYLATLKMNISNRLFVIYLSQPYVFHLQHNSGQLIQNIASETNIFTGRFLNSIAVIFSEVLVMTGILILLITVEPVGASVVISVFIGVGWLTLYLTRKPVKKWGIERQFNDGKRIQHLQQGLGGVKDALLLNRTETFVKKYQAHNFLSTSSEWKQGFVQDIPRFWFEVLVVLGITLMVIIMSYQGKQVSTILSILGIFAVSAFRLMPSITRIIAATQSLQYSFPVLNTIYRELNLKSPNTVKNIVANSTNKNLKFNNAIVFNNVNFTYPLSDKPSLSNILLRISKGECIGIVGSSGSGKSTLADVMLGLLKSDSGEVLVDNRNIHENIRNWQDHIGYVPQSIYLVDDSLRNNIAFGIPEDEIEHSRVERAISAAHLSNFIHDLPMGLDTFVGERGVRLSGGQRQRVGIARALYCEPDVLILDEATSSLDNLTERRVMQTIYELHKEKTIIIIAHRLTTIVDCDRLYRLENGTIVEEGSPQELLKNG